MEAHTRFDGKVFCVYGPLEKSVKIGGFSARL